jgi:hypothetical protein
MTDCFLKIGANAENVKRRRKKHDFVANKSGQNGIVSN